MKHLLLSFALLFTSFSLLAQWERLTDEAGGQVNALSRAINNELWAGTHTGLFYSSDQGATWNRHTSIAPTWRVMDIESIDGEQTVLSVQSLGHPAYRLVVSTGLPGSTLSSEIIPGMNPGSENARGGLFKANGVLMAWGGNQIARKTGGVNWTILQLPALSLYSVHGEGNLIAAAVQQSGSDPGRLRYSVNGGQIWETPVLPGASTTESVVSVFVRGNRIWAAYSNGDLYRSDDAGQAWLKTSLPSQPPFSYYETRFRWDAVLDRLTVCIDGALYASPNFGQNWMSLGVVSGHEVKDFLPEGDRLSVGSQWGFAQRTAPAAPFVRSNEGLQGDPTVAMKTYGNESFAVFTTAVKRSTDGGNTWATLNIGPLAEADFQDIRGFEKDGDRQYLLTNKGLLVSADNGVTWPNTYTLTISGGGLQLGAPGELWITRTPQQTVTVLNAADPSTVLRTFSTLLTAGSNDNLYTVYYDPWDGNILGYLPENSTIYASANKGKDWVVRATIPGVQNLAGSFYQASGSNGRLFFLSSNAIFYSADHGFTWTKSGGATGSIGSIQQMVEAGNGYYALTLNQGILRSINLGTTWSLAFNNATGLYSGGMAATTVGNEARLLIGTRDRGVWRYNPLLSTSPFKLESGQTTVCPEATATYCLAALPLASHYSWLLPTQVGVAGTLQNPVIQEGSEGRCLEVFFNTQNAVTATISVTYDGNAWPVSVTAGFFVTIKPLPPTTLPTVTVPFENLPFQVPLTGEPVPASPGTYTFTQVLMSFQGCDSTVRQTVVVSPPQIGTVLGSVYWDNNNNGFFNSSTDKWAVGILVQSSSGLFTTTGPDGKYTLSGLQAGDTVRVVLPLPTTVASPGFIVHQPGVWAGNFRLYNPPIPPDLDIDITNTTIFRPGFSTEILITCHNLGLQTAQNVQVKVALPNWLIIDLIAPAPAQQIGDTIIWNLGTLSFGEARTMHVYVTTPVNTPLNTPLLLTGTVYPVLGDAVPGTNSTRLSAWVRGSCDPNDKQVSPAYVTPAMLANQERLYYTIRFQNTGNFPADFVRITDTLGADVNPATFRFITSSHACTWKLLGKGVVEFFFENIHLPDSSTNEAGSHGFVKFSIKADAGLPLGAVVENTAHIYFDYNPPIRTNTIGTQVVYFLPGEPPAGDELHLRPNPAMFRAYCNWDTPLPTSGMLKLYNLRGLLELEMSVAEGDTEATFEVMYLTPSVYLAVLEAGPVFLVKMLTVMPPDGLND